jgi:hypothetical protein
MKPDLVWILVVLVVLLLPAQLHAGPANGTYELIEYGFGNGGTENSSNSTYKLNAIAGEQNGGLGSNGTYKIGDGLIFTHMADVPPAPTFTNPSSNYDRLKFVLNTSGNPSDTQYAIAISSDNFATTRYVQSDNTVGSVLGSEDWQTYTTWGDATGAYVTGLTASTTYKIKVEARQGNFTQTGFGPTATASTVDPSLTFSVSANSITFNNLNSGNSYTDTSKSTTLTTSTNAYNGYIVYAHETVPLTSNSATIANYASPNSSPTTWSGTGFGYTTDDSSLTGGTTNRFTNGGAKYAGFVTTIPGDPVADHPGPVTTAISNEQFTVSYRVTVPSTQNAGTYNSKLIYIVVPTF